MDEGTGIITNPIVSNPFIITSNLLPHYYYYYVILCTITPILVMLSVYYSTNPITLHIISKLNVSALLFLYIKCIPCQSSYSSMLMTEFQGKLTQP